MRIENYQFPKSSFLSIEKDLSLIIDKILKNTRIKKLLYYDTSDALDKPELDEQKVQELIEKNIKIIPKIKLDNTARTYLCINFDHFTDNDTNPEFRDNDIIFDIICHIDQWQLKDFQLRPYKIAGEIDYMFNKKRLTGIGLLEFVGANVITVNADYVEICMMYRAVHGEEDKQDMLNPNEWQDYIETFESL